MSVINRVEPCGQFELTCVLQVAGPVFIFWLFQLFCVLQTQNTPNYIKPLC